MLSQPSPPENGRINLAEQKSNIAKRLGPERAHLYFSSLNKLLSNKLSKTEFNKLCFSVLGHENVPLHNQLIRSILKNAFSAKVPPPSLQRQVKGPAKSFTAERDHGAPHQPIWSNGGNLRKSRSDVQHKRSKDCVSRLGPNGRLDIVGNHSSASYGDLIHAENGVLAACDLKRPLQEHEGGFAELRLKRRRTDRPSPYDQGFVHSKNLAGGVVVEETEDIQPRYDFNSARGPLSAPLGIPSYPTSLRGKSLPLANRGRYRSSCISSYGSGDLCHTEVLRQKMEKIAELQGVQAVTMDCANLLNHGLDVYLKRLIKSSLELVGARSGPQTKKQQLHKQLCQEKPINGVWTGNHMYVQSTSQHMENVQEPRFFPVSLQDFKVAMELNPQQLGEDWPLLLEKICLNSFEE